MCLQLIIEFVQGRAEVKQQLLNKMPLMFVRYRNVYHQYHVYLFVRFFYGVRICRGKQLVLEISWNPSAKYSKYVDRVPFRTHS